MSHERESRLKRWIMDPLRGKTSFGNVFGWYGIVGSLVYSALGLLIDVESERAMQVYTIGGLIFSVYVTIAMYRCAVSLRSSFARNLVRVSAVLSLALLPVLAYLAYRACSHSPVSPGSSERDTGRDCAALTDTCPAPRPSPDACRTPARSMRFGPYPDRS
jgi:hypothetical protein